MPEARVILTTEGIEQFLSFVFASTDCRVYETYSEMDKELREFCSVSELASAFSLGVDPHGHGVAQQLSLWSPSVMPRPTVRRITLKVPGHQFRFTIEGCGLFSLLLGGVHKTQITSTKLSYWAEAGAKQRCAVQPGPDEVDWAAYKKLGGVLSRQAKKIAKSANQPLEPTR